MTQALWASVDRYFSDLLVGQDEALEAALRDSAAAGLPAINVAASQGKFLMLMARAMNAASILEIGTLGGYSAIWLARGLAPGGSLVTLEAEPKHAEVARRNIERAGLGRCVELMVGKAGDTLPRLVEAQRGPFDLVFIDADKPGYPGYLPWVLRLSRVGTMIIADNVVRDGEIANGASTDANVQGVRRFNEMLAAEKRLSATAIQTVGSKGYDGFAMALVVA